MREARLGAEENPTEEGHDRNDNYGRHKIRGDAIGQALERRAAALCFADEFHNLRKRSFAADALRFHDEAAAGVQRSAGDLVARGFFNWHGLTRYHRFIDGARAFANDPIDGNALARTDTEAVAAFHLIERNILFGSVRIQDVRLLRRQIQ